jgi:hypothetical protein
MVKIKENSLKEKVDEMLERKMIKTTEEVGVDSFVVGRELSKEGKVENPRIQFLVNRLSEDFQKKLLGKKAGDLISEESKLDLEILQIYNFVENEENLNLTTQNTAGQEDVSSQEL